MFARLGSSLRFSRFVRFLYGCSLGCVFLLLGFYVLPKVAAVVTGRPVADLFAPTATLLAASGFFISALVVLFRFRPTATTGAVLLDCGALPGRNYIWGASAFVLLTQLVLGDGLTLKLTDLSLLAMLAFNTVIGFSRRQFRQNGLWVYSGLVRWSKIEWYYWLDNLTLRFRVREFLGLPREFSLRIPRTNRQAVTDLLKEYLPERALELNPSVPGGSNRE